GAVLGPAAALRAIADLGATAAEGVVVRARRDLTVAALPRQPHLGVVALGRAEPQVADAALDHAVRELEALQHRLGVPHHRFQLVGGLGRRRELHELHFVELVLAIDPFHVLAVRPSVAPVAGRAGRVAARERGLRQHLARMQRGERDLRRRDEIERAALVGLDGLEELLLELRQLARLEHRLAVHEMGYPDLRVAVLARVEVERLDALPDLAHPSHLHGGVLATLPGLADRLRGAVTQRLEVLRLPEDAPAGGVVGDDVLDVVGPALAGERPLDRLGLLADQPDVQHGATALRRAPYSRSRPGRPSRRGRRPRGR